MEPIMLNDDRTMATSRTLPYAPEVVYGAFESPDLLASWWGPEGFTNSFEVFEFRVGGSWTFIMHGPDGTDYANSSVFEALEPAARVVIKHDCAPHFTLTVRLTGVEAGTHLSWEQVFDDSKTAQAVRDLVGAANEQNLDRLTRVLGQAPMAA
jgi:uncharacterized protein YndB with AHSA1/START domain